MIGSKTDTYKIIFNDWCRPEEFESPKKYMPYSEDRVYHFGEDRFSHIVLI